MHPDSEAQLTRAASWLAAAAALVAVLLYVLAAAQLWVTGRAVAGPVAAIVGMARVPWHLSDPAGAFGQLGERMAGPGAWWAIFSLTSLTGMAAVVALAGWVDGLRGRRRMGARSYDPRGRVRPRAFARPRDLRHLRTGGADSWTMLRLDGRLIGTAPETHVLTIAPTRSGKTTGPVTTWALEHEGPAIITSTKADIVALTAGARAAHGPVWVFAPAVPAAALPVPACGWTPLEGCDEWEHAQMTGRWLASNAQGGNDASEDSGARFYNHEAGRLLAPLLHAAALSECRMATVNAWLRSESNEPLTVLRAHGASAAVAALDAFRKMDGRPKSLTIASAGQLIDAYEYESIQETDRHDFTPERLLEEGGTLYLVAPEGRQDMVGPLFAALLGATFRACELHALEHGPLDPNLRVILDESRRLAAIDDLPALLSVSGGWGVRIATVWQNLDQITARYAKQSEEILGNSLAKLILGPIQDAGTRDYLVDLLDGEHVDELTWDLDELGGRRARSMQQRERAKASAQSLQQLARGEGLLIHGRDLPVKGRVLAFWERRDLKRLVEAKHPRLTPAARQAAHVGESQPAATRVRRRVMICEVGELLVAERRSRDLSVEQVAGRSGVLASVVAAIEEGDALPSVDELAALLAACGLQLERNAAGELSYLETSPESTPAS